MDQPNQQSTKPGSSQDFLPIKEIKDGILVLKNGFYRTVLLVKTSGYELKSEAEQNAINSSFEGFINSLTFPIQIVMQSRKVNLAPYLEKLQKIVDKQTTEIMRIQAENYIDFVKMLIANYNIMSKNFYVIVAHNPGGLKKVGLLSGLFGNIGIAPSTNFDREKVVLLEKTDLILSGLQSIGLRVAQLNTQELLELFYNTYNPSISQNEKISNIGSPGPIVTTRLNKK